MKNSKEYSQKVQKLYRTLKRKHKKPQKVTYEEPLEAFVYAAIAEYASEKVTHSVIKRIHDNFIDLNDLRVSLSAEIIEILGKDIPVARNVAALLLNSLASVFNQYNTISLEDLKKMGKRPARQALERISGATGFIVDYCVLTSLQGHSIPLTKPMVEYLKSNEIVHPEADEQAIEGFLVRQITAKSGYDFYALLRRESELRRGSSKKKAEPKAKEKVKKKAVSKTETTAKAKKKVKKKK